MEQYNTLWEKDQKIIFDLGNIVNSIYVRTFRVHLSSFGQIMSLETCLRSVYFIDLFQSSINPLKQAILTQKI